MDKKKIIIGSVIFIVLIICLLIFKPSKTVTNKKNSYNYETKSVELPNTVKYTNDNLSKNHCVNDICISNLVFYTLNDSGRIEYNIYNSSNDMKSGVLRLNFSGKYLYVVYKGLLGKNTISSFSEFEKVNISNKEDYIIEEYSGKDIIDKNK